MSFLKSTPTLKNEVLSICGELTDGSSDFEDLVVASLDDAYQGLLSGGNEFGIDAGLPWKWARAKRPIVLSLLPEQTGSATLTLASSAGSFASGPTLSQAGRFLRLEGVTDIYRIATHIAGATAFTIDQAFLSATGSYNYHALALDYDLVDNSILVDSTNKKIDFRENSSAQISVSLTEGAYTPTTFATHVGSVLTANTTAAATYTCSFDSITRKFTIVTNGTYLDFLWNSGTNFDRCASELLGFDISNSTGALTYTSVYANSGILRLTDPITMYQEAPIYGTNAKDAGKIFIIDHNTFIREFPIGRFSLAAPDKAAVIKQTDGGIWTLRFNASMSTSPMRIEINHIPVTRKLCDNASSFPKVPGSFSKYLVFAAAHFVLIEKSDAKADKYGSLAQAKLQALVADERKNKSLAGNSFARLIPRRGSIWTRGYVGDR